MHHRFFGKKILFFFLFFFLSSLFIFVNTSSADSICVSHSKIPYSQVGPGLVCRTNAGNPNALRNYHYGKAQNCGPFGLGCINGVPRCDVFGIVCDSNPTCDQAGGICSAECNVGGQAIYFNNPPIPICNAQVKCAQAFGQYVQGTCPLDPNNPSVQETCCINGTQKPPSTCSSLGGSCTGQYVSRSGVVCPSGTSRLQDGDLDCYQQNGVPPYCCSVASPADTDTPTPKPSGGGGTGGGEPTPTPTPIAKCAEGVGSPVDNTTDDFNDPGGPQIFCVVPTCNSTTKTCSAKITWAERVYPANSSYRIVIAPSRPSGSDQGGYEYFTIGSPPQTIDGFVQGTTYTMKVAGFDKGEAGIHKTGKGPGYGTPFWSFIAESAVPTVAPTGKPCMSNNDCPDSQVCDSNLHICVNTATPTVTPASSPTPTGGTGEPGIVTVMLKLDSIDAQDQKIQRSPKHNSRKVTIFLYKNSNFNNDPFGSRADYKITGNVFFTKGDSTKPQTYGLFVGKTSNGNFDFKKVVTGDYYVFVKTEATLREPLEDSPQQTRIDISNGMILDFSQDSSRSLPTGELIGADNALTIDDFNAIVTCYNFPNNKEKVTDCQNLPGIFDNIFSATPMVDLNDDGSIDGIDLNIFLRNYRNNSTGF